MESLKQEMVTIALIECGVRCGVQISTVRIHDSDQLFTAEFEKGILSERVKSGLNRTKEEGKVLGRPFKAVNIKKMLEDRKNRDTLR